MVYYFGLVVSENANAIGYAYGEYGQFGYKVDCATRLRRGGIKTQNDTLQEGANTSSCRGANFGSIAAEIAHRRVSGSAECARNATDATAVETAATAV